MRLSGLMSSIVGIWLGQPMPALSQALPLNERVPVRLVAVKDGDSVVVASDRYGIFEVRMAGIDAPETTKSSKMPGQPFADESKHNLERLTSAGMLSVSCPQARDYYARGPVCFVYGGESNLNYAQVLAGLAWVDRYSRDRKLLDAQQVASHYRRGLWKQDSPTAPHEWRKVCWREGRCD